MESETIDGLVFLLTTSEQQAKLEATWRELGGAIDEVGDGVKLFETRDAGVVFRTREQRTN